MVPRTRASNDKKILVSASISIKIFKNVDVNMLYNQLMIVCDMFVFLYTNIRLSYHVYIMI